MYRVFNDCDIENKINKFICVLGYEKTNIFSRNTRKVLRLEFYTDIAVTVLLYGSETNKIDLQNNKTIEEDI